MKRIICLIESLGSGGAERQLTYLASQLKEKGYEVEVWTYYPNDFYAHILYSAGVKWRFISEAQSKLKRIFVLKRQLSTANPDTVIAYLDTCTSVACIIKALGAKFRLIVSERNTTQKLTLRERVKFFLYRWADCVVPNSYTQTKFISDHYPSLCGKVHTITNFVDTDKFCPPVDRVSNEKLRILTVARVVPQKNVLRLLEAVKLLKDSGYDFKYDWYGNPTDDEYYQLCKEAISMYGIEDVFEFHKQSKNIVSEYQRSDAFCLPSLYEGFPNVICEAMSCGIPVVCSDVCDNRKIVEHGINGYLFSPFSLEEIVTSLSLLFQSDTDYGMFSMNSRAIALNKFDKSTFILSYCNLIL